MSTFFVTGGAGFIGSHFCRLALTEGWCERLVNFDALTYAGNLSNVSEISNRQNYEFIRGDLNEGAQRLMPILDRIAPEVIIHFAAESHVDRSIDHPSLFLETNILGTHNLLEAIRLSGEEWAKKVRFVFISTDEVYGSLGKTGQFFENTPLAPRSPYACSKASADMLVSAYHETFGFDTVIVRCSNNFGPNQFPEKLIPQTIILAIQNKMIPVYGRGDNVRDWLYVEDFARGIRNAALKGESGEVFNFGGRGEHTNLFVVQSILAKLGKPDSLIQFVTDRKGHDFRYSMNFDKAMAKLGWQPSLSFEDGLNRTIDWYVTHQDWWASITSGEYLKFFERYYGGESLASVQCKV